jgi:disulfide bond formation protein DsbB
MVKISQRFLFFVCCTLSMLSGYAQDSTQHERPQMAELMRSNGKIYVVVTVLLIILAGIFIYLIQLDRKMSRMEKNKN